ncbi:virulence-associated E family protein [Pectinatus haikarae]|uniref:virulence-associated E family protein n=1 Tax=Pectinatus haikarae TaxID=349096 RepID=UPI0018C4DAB4|nr:virulence-associated E family protein [Pectinatus haikarae]
MRASEKPAVSTIKHDGEINIAVGHSRKSKAWKNKMLLWSALVKRLSETKRTNETAAIYRKLSKLKQDEIKDVGGFVGGTLKGGRRTADNVGWRQIITLDADFADSDFWDNVAIGIGGCAALAYSTHKHTKDTPRFRLVLPLSRSVNPDEYQAIARKIADNIGIDMFDDTTYQPHRLMYFPSTPADGEFYFKFYDGPWFDADKCLDTYPDWTDQSYWPTSSRLTDAIKKHAAKQEDPLDKKGIIGAFCRTYTIQEAISKFLPDVYEPCGADDRYTYKEGSTSAGAIVYDNKFLYSHHSTDPISEMLVNAFDLVRVHKFRGMDEDASESTKTVSLPSYKAMQRLAADDDKTKILIGQERLAEAQTDFKNVKTDNGEWLKKLDINKWGAYENTPKNVKVILENDPNLKNCLGSDEFAHRWIILNNLPWHDKSKGVVWRNEDDSMLRNYLSDVYDISGKDIINDALVEVVDRHSFHPVKEYIRKLQWDGIPRLETLFIDYLGAQDTTFNRTVSRKTLVAAIARILSPGCKFDYVLTFIGAQGIGKSYMLKKLAGKWCSDSLTTLSGKEAMEAVQGFWIIELAELSALRKSELEATKQFITKQEDSFRPAYGRRTEQYPRQCIFIATTNENDFIRDQTGGRRWWPMLVDKGSAKRTVKDLTQDEIDQVWAEAKHFYDTGEQLYLPDNMEIIAKELQESHTESSPLAGMISEYLDKLLPENWESIDIGERRAFINDDGFTSELKGTVQRDRVCALEIWIELLNGDPKRLDRLKANEINGILRKMPGWEASRNGLRFGRFYGFQRGFQRGFIRKDES